MLPSLYGMASQDELIRMMQSQMATWQAEASVQLERMKHTMQAAFDQKMAEMTTVQDSGEERRERKNDRAFFYHKHFHLCNVFDGSLAGVKWEEWQFDFLRAVHARSAECGDVLESVLREAGSTSDLTSISVEPQVRKHGPQLFSILCGLTTGEANLIVRSTNEKGAGYCGFAALCLLSRRYNPKTPARVLQNAACQGRTAPRAVHRGMRGEGVPS